MDRKREKSMVGDEIELAEEEEKKIGEEEEKTAEENRNEVGNI